jgi:hypothetical protein
MGIRRTGRFTAAIVAVALLCVLIPRLAAPSRDSGSSMVMVASDAVPLYPERRSTSLGLDRLSL